jgi:hypothetical protein
MRKIKEANKDSKTTAAIQPICTKKWYWEQGKDMNEYNRKMNVITAA